MGKFYMVSWHTAVMANSHTEAAELARRRQLDPDSEELIFYSRLAHGKTVMVDLSRPT